MLDHSYIFLSRVCPTAKLLQHILSPDHRAEEDTAHPQPAALSLVKHSHATAQNRSIISLDQLSAQKGKGKKGRL